MPSTSENNKRIVLNTLLLYVRMFFTMGVSLYTSRIVLNVLGVEDFGIYNVVGGVVAMFSIVSGSLSAAISRFITFELGKENQERLKKIFSSAVIIQIALALIICFLAETVGVWFLNHKMNIPPDRMIAANWVLQCSTLTFMINLISIPYNAAIIAHERMKAFAYVSILEVSLKLAIVFTLYISVFDKLITYSILLLIVAAIIRLVYGIYCRKHFAECTLHLAYDKAVLKELTSFAGWNFIGSSSAILRDQGVNIAINLFCGPAANAARGISLQVNSAIQSFVTNFMTALNPQITKSYAAGNKEYMMNLIFQGARFSFFLLLLLSLPIIIEANSILTIWLGVVPAHTLGFVRLVLIYTMIESISGPLITAMLAHGKIKTYQIIVGGLQMINFPVSYALLYWGVVPEITMVVAIIISHCCLIARLLLLRNMIGISAKSYFKKVYANIILVSILSSILPVCIYTQLSAGLDRFIIVAGCSLICTSLAIFYAGCSNNERAFIIQKVCTLKDKLIKK